MPASGIYLRNFDFRMRTDRSVGPEHSPDQFDKLSACQAVVAANPREAVHSCGSEPFQVTTALPPHFARETRMPSSRAPAMLARS